MSRLRARERGASTLEYAALLLVLSIVVGGVFAADLPSKAETGGKSAICKIFSSGDCGSTKKGPDARMRTTKECQAFCPTANNPIHPSDPVTAATKGGYVAMGDSYSSGEGAAKQYLGSSGNTGCHRAPGAYSQGILREFTFHGALSFVACSGATSDEVISGYHGEESQLDALSPRTTLVTVSAGGNDVHFADIMKNCVLDAHFSAGDLWPGHAPHPDKCQAQQAKIESDVNYTFGSPPSPSRYRQFLEKVHEKAPNARILVVGYPSLFPQPPAKGYATITKGDQEFLNKMADELNGKIRQAASATDAKFYGNGEQKMGSIEYVDNSGSMDGHELTADDPWINGIDICAGLGLSGSNQNCRSKVLPSVGTSSFHPTSEGQKAFQKAIRKQLVNGPNRTLYDP